ncbi:hypothetical protein [Qipengyuania thermophila]|uniref:hypothetical protein n=1 Tax=Bacteria TaxID=2 RepID=UPI0036F31F60
MSFFIDQKSFIFLSIVLLVRFSVSKYSFYYIRSKDLRKFLCLLSSFIFSIVLLCSRTSLI